MLLAFDYDGVVADSLAALLEYSRVVQSRIAEGRRPTEKDFTTIDDLTWDGLALLFGIPPAKITDFTAEVFRLQSTGTKPSCFFPAIPEVLALLVGQTARDCHCFFEFRGFHLECTARQSCGVFCCRGVRCGA